MAVASKVRRRKTQSEHTETRVKPILCQVCKEREAVVHISPTRSLKSRRTKHFCRQCADEYWARTPGMNADRGLIQLSNFYRSKLYDLLQKQHPEAFDNSTVEACRNGSELMRRFLRRRLNEDNIKVTGDAFEMLCNDFSFSHHSYKRGDQLKANKG